MTIDTFSYNEASHDLTINFDNGETHIYHGVSKEIYESFLATESKSDYYEQNIKGRWYAKLT